LGLKYDIGDALGIFPHNIPEKVADFLNYYGLNPMQCVSINIHGKCEICTIEQTFTQFLDLFGRPGRRFYDSFSKFAQDPKEKAKLECADDTVTHAELLPCHYSIASAMSMHLILYIYLLSL